MAMDKVRIPYLGAFDLDKEFIGVIASLFAGLIVFNGLDDAADSVAQRGINFLMGLIPSSVSTGTGSDGPGGV